MRTTSMRLVAALVVTSVAVGGVSPLAQAQQPTPPADSTPLEQSEQPMAPPEPAVTPAPPAATTPPIRSTPDFFQEQMKEQQASAQRKQVLYEAGAVVTNVFLIPGRAITCALGTGLGVVVLAITFGTGYKTAAGAFDEGCGGKWVVNGDDLKPDGGSRAFEWER